MAQKYFHAILYFQTKSSGSGLYRGGIADAIENTLVGRVVCCQGLHPLVDYVTDVVVLTHTLPCNRLGQINRNIGLAVLALEGCNVICHSLTVLAKEPIAKLLVKIISVDGLGNGRTVLGGAGRGNADGLERSDQFVAGLGLEVLNVLGLLTVGVGVNVVTTVDKDFVIEVKPWKWKSMLWMARVSWN